MVEATNDVEVDPEEARLSALFAPLKEDKAAWEASFTEEERAKGAAFEETLRTNVDEARAFQ